MTTPLLVVPVETVRLRSRADYARFRSEAAETLARQRVCERALAGHDEAFGVTAWCYPCGGRRELRVDRRWAYEIDGELTPNWREHLVCTGCGLNNRMRATIHLIEQLLAPRHEARLYLTEQLSALFRWLAARYPQAVGSEFLGETMAPGSCDARGLRHEDLTRLSFADGSLELVVSLDVLEHVPACGRALAECRRVLAAGGALFLTVPFLPERQSNLVRARRRDDGTIEHLEVPEYHGDPLQTDGCLAYYHFGWELLETLRGLGFEEVEAHLYWSREHGYLGRDQLAFVARKPGRSLGGGSAVAVEIAERP